MTASSSPMSWRRPRLPCKNAASRHRSKDLPLLLQHRPRRSRRRKRPEAASNATWRPVYSFESSKGFRAAVFISLVATAVGAGGYVHATGLSRVNVGAQAPKFSARGADGKQHNLRDYAGKLVVLEWTSPVCPFTAVKY